MWQYHYWKAIEYFVSIIIKPIIEVFNNYLADLVKTIFLHSSISGNCFLWSLSLCVKNKESCLVSFVKLQDKHDYNELQFLC